MALEQRLGYARIFARARLYPGSRPSEKGRTLQAHIRFARFGRKKKGAASANLTEWACFRPDGEVVWQKAVNDRSDGSSSRPQGWRR